MQHGWGIQGRRQYDQHRGRRRGEHAWHAHALPWAAAHSARHRAGPGVFTLPWHYTRGARVCVCVCACVCVCVDVSVGVGLDVNKGVGVDVGGRMSGRGCGCGCLGVVVGFDINKGVGVDVGGRLSELRYAC